MIWHSAPLSDVLNELKTGSENGVSPAEAAERLRKVGLNQLKEEEKSSPFRHLLSRLADPWSILLVLAVVVTIIINLITGSGSWWEPILILAVLLLNAAFTAIFKQKLALKARRRFCAAANKWQLALSYWFRAILFCFRRGLLFRPMAGCWNVRV